MAAKILLASLKQVQAALADGLHDMALLKWDRCQQMPRSAQPTRKSGPTLRTRWGCWLTMGGLGGASLTACSSVLCAASQAAGSRAACCVPRLLVIHQHSHGLARLPQPVTQPVGANW